MWSGFFWSHFKLSHHQVNNYNKPEKKNPKETSKQQQKEFFFKSKKCGCLVIKYGKQNRFKGRQHFLIVFNCNKFILH